MTHPGVRGRRIRSVQGFDDGTKALRQVVTLILGQLSAIAALAYYFGRAWTGAWLDYFGLNTSLVDFSTTEYVLRSIGLSYWPLMALGSLVVVALFVDPFLRLRLERASKRQRKWV